jgi:hypothetical protein
LAARFPLYTDADIRGDVVQALLQRDWDLVRAVDLYPEGMDDEVHFERAARDNRVLVAYDVDQQRIALDWLRRGRPFRGLITWTQARHRDLSAGDIADIFEDCAALADPFAGYPILYLKPRSSAG